MPRVAVTTLGCKVNQFESEVMEGLFKARGVCGRAFRGAGRRLCDKHLLGDPPGGKKIPASSSGGRPAAGRKATVVVTGCYAQVSADEVAAIEGVDVIVGTQDRQRIVDLAEEAPPAAAG